MVCAAARCGARVGATIVCTDGLQGRVQFHVESIRIDLFVSELKIHAGMPGAGMHGADKISRNLYYLI